MDLLARLCGRECFEIEQFGQPVYAALDHVHLHGDHERVHVRPHVHLRTQSQVYIHIGRAQYKLLDALVQIKDATLDVGLYRGHEHVHVHPHMLSQH